MKTRHVFMLLMLLLAASTGFANDVAATTVANSTEKKAYYLFNSETKTLTCYFDTNKSARSGQVFDHFLSYNNSDEWEIIRNVNTVTFDESFKDYHGLTSTKEMFRGYDQLTTINNLTYLNTENVTDMKSMFYDCTDLTSLDLSNFNTEQVTDMSLMFNNCKGLTSLDLSTFRTEKVTDMTDMFNSCSALTTLDLKMFNTQNVTRMVQMFAYCTNLTSVDVSSFDTSKLTDMEGMFRECESLKTVDVNSFDISKVQRFDFMFLGCKALTTIYCDNSWTDNLCQDYDYISADDMFDGCTSLVGAVAFNEEQIEVEMANPNTGYFTEKNPRRAYALLSADKGTLTFYYDRQHDTRPTEGEVVYDVPWEGSEPGWCSFNSGFNLTTTTATFDPSFDDFHGLTSVNNMFAKLRYLRTVNGLEYLHTENVTDFAFMFYGCTSLKTLDLSCLNTSSATTMVSMFHGCNEMERLWLLGFDTRNVTNMDDMFGGCEKLKAIYCEDTWTPAQSRDMFKACYDISGAINYDTDKIDATYANPETGYFRHDPTNYTAYAVLTDNQLTFYFDSKRDERAAEATTKKVFDIVRTDDLSFGAWTRDKDTGARDVETVTLDHSFKFYEAATNTSGMFNGMKNLTSIDGMYNLYTDNVTDMSHMFQNCSALLGVDVGSFVTDNVTDMNGMFYNCEELRSLNAENFKTKNVTNMNGLFYNCKMLKELDLGGFDTRKVTDMRGMFQGCESLETFSFSDLFITNNVTDMSDMFHGCTSLTDLDYFSLVTDKVTKMSGMFQDCSSLKTLDVTSFNTCNVTDMAYMFKGCSRLTELDLSRFSTDKVTAMNDMFNGCSKLTTIYCNDAWSCSNSNGMFAGCVKLAGATAFDETKVNADMANPTDGYFTSRYIVELKDGADNREVLEQNAGRPAQVKFIDRTFWQDGRWNTLILPFDIDSDDPECGEFFRGTTIMRPKDASFDEATGTLTISYEQLWPLPSDPDVQHQSAYISGYVPFFIKWNDGFMNKETELIIGRVTMSEYQPQQCSIDVGDGSILTFKSTLAPLVINGADRSKLFLGIDNILHYPDGKEPTRINALRAYFQLTNGYVFGEPESTEDVKAIKQCVLDFDNDEQGTTDIREMVNAESANGQWYDLSGRRISKPARGIYINGRKKVVVK